MNQEGHGKNGSYDGQGSANIANIGNRTIRDDHAAEPRTTTDTEVKNAGIHGHGYSRRANADGLNDFSLEDDVIGHDGNAPKDTERNNRIHTACSWIQKQQGNSNTAHNSPNEFKAEMIIKFRAKEAANEPGCPEDSEDNSDNIIGELRHLQEERFNIAISRIIGRSV